MTVMRDGFDEIGYFRGVAAARGLRVARIDYLSAVRPGTASLGDYAVAYLVPEKIIYRIGTEH
jgi:hypothetical protein